MSAIRTTFSDAGHHRGARTRTIPYLQPREVAGIMSAVESGALVAVASETVAGAIGAGEIVAVATPEIAERLTARDPDLAGELLSELREAARELRNLRTIAGEVMAEREPAEFLYRIENAADDVKKAIDNAIDYAEDL